MTLGKWIIFIKYSCEMAYIRRRRPRPQPRGPGWQKKLRYYLYIQEIKLWFWPSTHTHIRVLLQIDEGWRITIPPTTWHDKICERKQKSWIDHHKYSQDQHPDRSRPSSFVHRGWGHYKFIPSFAFLRLWPIYFASCRLCSADPSSHFKS